MAICKNCKGQMSKEYIFEDGKSFQRYICPLCKATTKKIPVVFDENGKVIHKSHSTKHKKNQNSKKNFQSKRVKETGK